MTRKVAEASKDVYFGKVKDRIAPNQREAIYRTMCFGVTYTRAEIGKLCGYSQTSAGRALRELIDADKVMEVGRKRCSVTGEKVGAVALSLADGA